MALPIVAGSEVNTPSSGHPLDVGPLRQAALAPGRMAAAIGQDVGGVFQDVTDKIQNARNTKKVFDADLLMRQTKDQFLQDIQKNPNLAKDPGTWVPAYQDQVKSVEDQILNQKDLAPVAKRQLTMMTGNWALDSVSEVRGQALHREVADTKESGIATATAALNSGDPNQLPQAIASYKALNEAGVMGPKETAVRINQAPFEMAKSQANNLINSNPEQAPRIMKEQLASKMKPQDYRIAYKIAQEAQARAQNANAQELSGRIDDNPLHTIDPKLLSAWRNNDKISSAQYERIQNRVKSYEQSATRGQDKQERDEFNVAMMEADAAPTNGKDLQSWAAKVKDNGLSWTNPAFRRRLNEYVDRKVENVQKEGQSAETPIEHESFTRMREDPLAAGAKEINQLTARVPGTTEFVMTNEELKKKYPDKTRDQAVKDLQTEQARQFGELRDWFKAFPDAHGGKQPTDQEAEAKRQQIVMEPHIQVAQQQVSTTPVTSAEGMQKIQQNLAAGKPWYEGSATTVRVKDAAGRPYTIPAANLKKALGAGWTINQ